MNQEGKNLGKRLKQLREKEKLSQERIAAAMGISRPALSQIESGRRKISSQELVLFAAILNVSIESLLDPESEPVVVLPQNKTVADRNEMRISVPQKNLDKFREVLLYILNKVGSQPNIGETVIYKLLYFIDFDHYELYEEQLIGATYLKNTHGPTPVEFKKIVDRMIQDKEIEKIKSIYFQYPQTKYLPLRVADLSKLKASEIGLIDKVLNRFTDWNAARISEYSHGDVPWLTTENQKSISYESVFYRTAPYSVRDYASKAP